MPPHLEAASTATFPNLDAYAYIDTEYIDQDD
jgi:hypothetical protein